MILYWFIRGLVGLCLLGVSVVLVATWGAVKLMLHPPRRWREEEDEWPW